MIVEQYGLVYRRVTENDLEMLRYWRNQDFIRQTMQFQTYITPSMQKAWFNRINNKYNYYFIIEHEGKKVGMINCKDTEPDSRVAEGGIFIWDKDYWGTPVPAYAAFTMLEAVFEIFNSGNASIATVAKDNKTAIDFNEKLGYEVKGATPDGNYLKLYLTRERYFSHCKKLMKAAAILNPGKGNFKLTATPGELLADEINHYLKSRS